MRSLVVAALAAAALLAADAKPLRRKAEPQLDIESLQEGTGAEDVDLRDFRGANRNTFDVTLAAMHSSPHLALGFMRAVFGDDLDETIFGRDEMEQKSPWSLWWYAIAPGTLFVRYLTYFFDTNPLLVTALVVCYIGSDLSFWLDVVALIDPSTRNPALRAFLIRGLFSLLSGLLVFAAYLLLPLVLTVGVWTVLADFAFDVYATLGWASSLYILYNRARNLRHTVFTRVQVSSQRRDAVYKSVCEALATAEREGLFRADNYLKLYSQGDRPVATGAYGAVFFGTELATDRLVAIKHYRKYNRPGFAKTLSDLANAALVPFGSKAGPGVREHAFQRLAETMGEKLRLLDKKHVANARHEARVLTAVKAINHPCLLALQSAHTHRSAEGEDAMVIVTQRAGQELMDACGDGKMPFDTRLKIVQRLCDALAALHAGGIVHRDIKPDNVCVSMSDLTMPIIIDFGIALLPTIEDPFNGIGTPYFLSPEICRVLSCGDQQLKTISAAGATQAADVWALGITACEILFYNDPVGMKLEQLGLLTPEGKIDNEKLKMAMAEWTLRDTQQGLLAVSAQEAGATGDVKKEVMQLLMRMMHPDPVHRITAAQALQEKCFQRMGPPLSWPQAAAADATPVRSPPVVVAPVGGPAMGGAGALPRPVARGGSKEGTRDALTYEVENPTQLALLRMTVAEAAAAMATQMPGSLSLASTPAAGRGTALITDMKNAFVRRSFTDGTLDRERLGAVLTDLRLGASFDPDRIFMILDVDGNGRVDRRELFCGLGILLFDSTDHVTQLGLTFDAHDTDDDGFLTEVELGDMLANYGLQRTEAGFAALFRQLDTNGDGKISKQEFLDGIRAVEHLRSLFLGPTPHLRRVSSGWTGGSTDGPLSPVVSGVATVPVAAGAAAATAAVGAAAPVLRRRSTGNDYE